MATVGTDTSAAAINTAIVTAAQAWATQASDVLRLATYVDGLGTAGLELAGFTDSADAAAVLQAADYLKTVAQLFTGQAGQADPFNFASALARFIGPL